MKYVLLCIVAISLCTFGCTSTKYHAASLPANLVAPTNISAKRIDMSSLAGKVQPADQLAPGDAVTVVISTGIEDGKAPEWTLRITESGLLNIPLVGPVQVSGMRLTDAERAIASESIRRGVYVSPNVTLRMERQRSNRVTVVGAVERPMTYELPVGASDLMTAISMAEGFTETADTIVRVRHPPGTGARLAALAQTQQVSFPSQPPAPLPDEFEIDLSRMNEIPANQRELVDGSVLVVKEKPDRFVNVMGLVRSPAAIPMPKDTDMKLLDAISQAGGLTESLADKVKVIRKHGDKEIVIQASIREAKRGGAANLVLASNDLVSVEETPVTYTMGTIKTFIRFGFSSVIPGI